MIQARQDHRRTGGIRTLLPIKADEWLNGEICRLLRPCGIGMIFQRNGGERPSFVATGTM